MIKDKGIYEGDEFHAWIKEVCTRISGTQIFWAKS